MSDARHCSEANAIAGKTLSFRRRPPWPCLDRQLSAASTDDPPTSAGDKMRRDPKMAEGRRR
jgi:hypothetical protein